MLVWLIVTLILAQIYTASLTSMLTVQRLEPTIGNAEALKKDNSVVGISNGSFVGWYLQQHLKLSLKNIKTYGSEEEFVQAFNTRQISAAFLEAPYAKVFLAKYCNSFIKVDPMYDVGGFGFVSYTYIHTYIHQFRLLVSRIETEHIIPTLIKLVMTRYFQRILAFWTTLTRHC